MFYSKLTQWSILAANLCSVSKCILRTLKKRIQINGLTYLATPLFDSKKVLVFKRMNTILYLRNYYAGLIRIKNVSQEPYSTNTHQNFFSRLLKSSYNNVFVFIILN